MAKGNGNGRRRLTPEELAAVQDKIGSTGHTVHRASVVPSIRDAVGAKLVVPVGNQIVAVTSGHGPRRDKRNGHQRP